MSPPEVNIIVCVDSRECRYLEYQGRSGAELLHSLRELVSEEGLEDRVQVTHCGCILGCTYGPRIDVSRRWSGEKLLYGATAGDVNISIRGRVEMRKLPDDLLKLVTDQLPPDPAT